MVNADGYSPMCGHAVLANTKVAFKASLVRNESGEFMIAVPAGLDFAKAALENGEVTKTRFRNVPSFVYLRDQQVSRHRY